jgi:hypothetical protein
LHRRERSLRAEFLLKHAVQLIQSGCGHPAIDNWRILAEDGREARSVENAVQVAHKIACPTSRQNVHEGDPYAGMHQNVADMDGMAVGVPNNAPFQDGPATSQRRSYRAWGRFSFVSTTPFAWTLNCTLHDLNIQRRLQVGPG